MKSKKIVSDLNPSQQKAVEHFQGPALVLAGAGSGKTRVLTRRIAYLIAEYNVDPSSILAVTFTNKAANEMQARVTELIHTRPASWVGTFHSFAAGILRKEAEKLGYNSNYVIYDTTDQRKLIKEIMKDMNIDAGGGKARNIVSRISNAKSNLIRPSDYKTENRSFLEQATQEIYPEYQKRMKASNALDFDDLLLKTCQLFTEYESVLNYYQQKYKFLLIDEYQDVNNAQYRLGQLLAGAKKNIFVVGDPDQSIYGFRGADIRNILNFERDYPQAEVIKLEQNYRSRQKILEGAQSVIANNASRKEKDLWSDRGPGRDIKIVSVDSGSKEAEYVGRRIEKLVNEDYNYGDIVILYRTNAQSRSLEDIFMKMSIPYEIVGGLRFYERMEIKDIMAYLRLVYNPDDEASLLRVINKPRRGIGNKTVERVKKHAAKQNISLFEAISNPQEIAGLSTAYQKRVRNFAALIEELQDKLQEITMVELVQTIIKRTGYEKDLIKREGEDARERLENIGELQNLMREYLQKNENVNLGDFLEKIKLINDVDRWEDSSDRITMMTFHSAKGLEFPVVFMVGMDEGLFPHNNCLEDEEDIEEERRLCYVGMTRAQEELFLVRARQRRKYGRSKKYQPSRFLKEIKADVTCREEFAAGNIIKQAQDKTSDTDIIDNMPGIFTDDSTNNVSSQTEYQQGEKVKHPDFGAGEVISVKQENNGDEKVTVEFKDGSEKSLMVKYAPLQKQN